MKTGRLIVVMSASIAVGLVAGYRLALFKDHNRLKRNKTLARLSHDKVWSERNSDAAVKVAREIYTSDFIAHTWAGDRITGRNRYVERARSGDRAHQIDELPALPPGKT